MQEASLLSELKIRKGKQWEGGMTQPKVTQAQEQCQWKNGKI